MGIRNKKFFTLAGFVFLTRFFLSCGLDTFYTLEPPLYVQHQPLYDNTDYSHKYYEFYTNDAVNKSLTSFTYLGTAVYYRIYKNYSTLVTKNASINAVNNSSNYNTAAERLISMGYKQLNTTNGEITPLIGVSPTINAQRVKIRLTDYNAIGTTSPIAEYQPQIIINGTLIGQPRRVEGNHTFDFGRNAKESNSPLPSSTDADFEDGNFSTENIYYVDLYAVAVGRDTTYTTYYSNVLHLGVVAIDSSKEVN
ncbi:hypothetical protein [Treponema sp.]|uniref:hypothetical protein n=1 Tax=Treponema sp. TaxID=166 RepID=UPI00298DB66B|nr:hypothetical protein [Treponema sp.]MCR5613611.1 hypothetical protein [Treponema sp.]